MRVTFNIELTVCNEGIFWIVEHVQQVLSHFCLNRKSLKPKLWKENVLIKEQKHKQKGMYDIATLEPWNCGLKFPTEYGYISVPLQCISFVDTGSVICRSQPRGSYPAGT